MSRNNVRGPTSALTEFLKASGITATSIAARMQNDEDQPVAGPSGTRIRNENAEIEDGDEARQRRASTSTAYDSDNLDGEQEVEPQPAKKCKLTKAAEAKLKAKEKVKAKKKKNEKSDDGEEEDPYRALSRSWGGNFASPTKPVIGNFEGCAKCKAQFTVTRYTMPAVLGPGFLCHKCAKESGNDPFKKPAAPKRKKVPADMRTVVNFEEKRFPTLASLCIQLITKHIDDVETLGDIGAMNLDAISRALSKNRGLTPKNVHLFYNVPNTMLTLYDATNLPSPALETLGYLNPNLNSLRLDFCGHMDDRAMSVLSSSLPSLIHLELLGPFLVRSAAWVTFFKSHPSLQTFKITQSPRFDIEAMLALEEHCVSTLTSLRLREIAAMSDAFLNVIGNFKKIEELDIADPGKTNECAAEALQRMLSALSGSLRVLDVSRHEQVTDCVLKEGLAGMRHLDELVVQNALLLTDAGLAEFFGTWKNQPLRRIDMGRNHDLGSAALIALLNHSGERLEELGINGWGSVEVHALKLLSRLGGELRKLDVSWVREVDDFLVEGWMEGDAEDVEPSEKKGPNNEAVRSVGCTRLCEVKVWGCNKITGKCLKKKGVSILGVESHTIL